MSLRPGQKVGPYEVVERIGSGGMGQVYRARDGRLQRDVALKVLGDGLGQDPERVQRFMLEAQAAGALHHPNIVVIHDAGLSEAGPFLVTELLEGSTLRARLADGPLSVRQAVRWALQMARALAAAHAQGVTHRDLKPENVFITREGEAKLLDFGLASMAHPHVDPATTLTAPGTVLGTAGYMAPEQVRGKPADARADVFALGALLYEMLSGQRAFPGESLAERGVATLHAEPPALRGVPEPLARVVARCLEKSPEDRFQSARDVAFALEAVGDLSSSASGAWPARWRRRAPAWLLTAALGAAAAALVLRREVRDTAPPPVSGVAAPARLVYQRINSRRGFVFVSRFTPDGSGVLFTGYFDGKPPRVYSAVPGLPEARPFTAPNTTLAAVSRQSELAVFTTGLNGRLGLMSLTGSTVRELLDRILDADFHPDGRLLTMPMTAGNSRVEFPPGTRLYEGEKPTGPCRFSWSGRWVACIELDAFNPTDFYVSGRVRLIGLDGATRIVGGDWKMISGYVGGVAWAPGDEEIWLTASETGPHYELFAIRVSDGAHRLLATAPANLFLTDVAADGRVLLIRWDEYHVLRAAGPDGDERDLYWFDRSVVEDLTPDGRRVLFNEEHAAYVRALDGSPAVAVAQGAVGKALSPDGQWVLTCPTPPVCTTRRLVPTGVGAARELAPGKAPRWGRARFTPDGRAIVFEANAEAAGTLLSFGPPRAQHWQLWFQPLEGAPRPLTPMGFSGPLALSPDGRRVACVHADSGLIHVVPLQGGAPVPVPGSAGLVPSGWTRDGWVFASGTSLYGGIEVLRIHPRTGARRPWKTLGSADRSDLGPPEVFVAPGGAYAYGYWEFRSNLYLLSGLAPAHR